MAVDVLSILIPIIMWVGIAVGLIIPWLLFIIVCKMNPMVWVEAISIFNKTSVRIIDFLLNGQIVQYLRPVGKDKRIVIKKSSKNDPTDDEILTPTNPSNFEIGGRKVYCRIQGSDNNFNPTNLNTVVTDPMVQMFGSMRFEDGRRYERRMFLAKENPNMMLYLLFAGVIVAVIIMIALQYSGNSMLQQIIDSAKAAGQAAQAAAAASAGGA